MASWFMLPLSRREKTLLVSNTIKKIKRVCRKLLSLFLLSLMLLNILFMVLYFFVIFYAFHSGL